MQRCLEVLRHMLSIRTVAQNVQSSIGQNVFQKSGCCIARIYWGMKTSKADVILNFGPLAEFVGSNAIDPTKKQFFI